MQEIDRIPNPDVNTFDVNNEKNSDVEQPDETDKPIPVPPDKQPVVPVEEPPAGESSRQPKEIV